MTAKWGQSIRGKLIQITMLVCLVAVVLACALSVAQHVVDEREELDTHLKSFGRLISAGSEAALAFNDRKAAEEALSVLRLNDAFIGGGIYTARGDLFAKYSGGTVSPPLRLQAATADNASNEDRVDLRLPIIGDGERIGTVYLIADQRDRRARLVEDAQATAIILLVCLTAGFILSSKLQRRVTEPIVELARIAGHVSEHKDYSVRATPHNANGGDEIANLIAGFNGMLTEIEQRDDRLLLIQTHLEKAVACRTEELTLANEELLAAKNAAEKIAEVNVRLARESALILNNATDGILGIGLDNRATFINPAGSRMLGMTLSELQQKSIHEAIHHSHADGTPWPEADCTNTIEVRKGQAFGILDDTFWRPDGTSVPVEYSSQPMFDESGEHVGAVVIFRDVTERRAVERLKSEFVSTVSHELRTPLTSIRGALGLLGSGLLGTIGDKGTRMLEIAVSNTDRLVRLINDILDIERIGSGKSELSRGHLDAHAVMVQALEGVLSMADEAGVRLAIVRSFGDLWGDNDRIVQTLTNLLGNAIKFSPPDTTVTVSGAANGSEFVFCVSDQGRGIPEEKLETIFERFSQVDASDSRDKGGSGLGLAICQSIVRAHGGRIWAEKNDPAGSRFQFTIPLAVASTIAPESDDVMATIDPACSEPTVLVVEDDLDLARVMTTSLQNHGVRTLHAPNGCEAIQLSTQHVPNLIVLDPGLPDMSGFEVIAALRKNPTLSRIPILVYSALEVRSTDQAHLRLGPTEFLTKSRCTPAEFERHVIRLIAAVKSGSQHAA
jgi:PAS domain S-box-containing protein